MTRRCPLHGCAVHQAADLFPGSPTRFDVWCMAYPGGHGLSEWDVVNDRGLTVTRADPDQALRARRRGSRYLTSARILRRGRLSPQHQWLTHAAVSMKP